MHCNTSATNPQIARNSELKVKTGKTGKKTEFRRFSSNMQQVTYHFQYFGHAELISDVRFVKSVKFVFSKVAKLRQKEKPTALSIPRRSPIQVLTQPNVA